MDYKDKIRKLLALAKSPEPEEVKDELEKIGPPKEFKKTPQPKTVGELDAAWRGVEDGRKFDPSNKLEEKKQEA